MRFRSKHHWFISVVIAGYAAFAAISYAKHDHYMFYFYLFVIVLACIAWATSFTSLENGFYVNRRFGIITDRFALNEIWSIVVNPAPLWTLGNKCIFILRKSGKSTTASPERMDEFIAILRREAPQAEVHL